MVAEAAATSSHKHNLSSGITHLCVAWYSCCSWDYLNFVRHLLSFHYIIKIVWLVIVIVAGAVVVVAVSAIEVTIIAILVFASSLWKIFVRARDRQRKREQVVGKTRKATSLRIYLKSNVTRIELKRNRAHWTTLDAQLPLDWPLSLRWAKRGEGKEGERRRKEGIQEIITGQKTKKEEKKKKTRE